MARNRNGHGVDGEVAATEIFLDRLAVGHLRVTRGAVVGLTAVRGDFNPATAPGDPYGSERDARGPYRVRHGADALQYRLGCSIGGEVEVVVRTPQQGVPDTAAYQMQLMPVLVEPAAEQFGDAGHGEQPRERGFRRVAGGIEGDHGHGPSG